MKKILINISFLSIFCSASIYCGRLTKSINTLDVNSVQQILDQKKGITEEHKKKLFDLAKENVKKYKKLTAGQTKQEVWGGKPLALIFTLAGIATAVNSLFSLREVLKYGTHQPKGQEYTEYLAHFEWIAAPVLTILFLYYGLKKFWDLEIQKRFLDLETAQYIKNLIKNYPIEDLVNNDRQDKLRGEPPTQESL